MKPFLTTAVLSALLLAAWPGRIATGQTNSAKELVGLWEAKRRFGPDLRGTLFIKQPGGVLARAAKQSSPGLFHNLLAEPLGIKRYYLPISPGSLCSAIHSAGD